MTRKKARLLAIVSCGAVVAAAVGLILFASRDSIVFFYTPSEIASKNITPGTRVRIGGLVEKGSIVKGGDATVTFVVTDMTASTKVTYRGQLPDLFREGQGVVAEGEVETATLFKADTVLAKHDEKYMPKEISDKLKEQGVWRDAKPPQS